jgi:hypothetical protein
MPDAAIVQGIDAALDQSAVRGEAVEASPNEPIDLDFSVGAAVFGIAAAATVYEIGSAGYLHIPVTVTYSASGTTYDPTGETVQAAVTVADPAAADYLTADWLTRTGGADGLYARLNLSLLPTLAAGAYCVYIKMAGYVIRAPLPVTFR